MACWRSLHSAPLSLPRELAWFCFFFIAADWNWFLVVYYEAERWSAVSADTVCCPAQGETQSSRWKRIIKNTKDTSLSSLSSIQVLKGRKQREDCAVRWCSGLNKVMAYDIDGVCDSRPHFTIVSSVAASSLDAVRIRALLENIQTGKSKHAGGENRKDCTTHCLTLLLLYRGTYRRRNETVIIVFYKYLLAAFTVCAYYLLKCRQIFD